LRLSALPFGNQAVRAAIQIAGFPGDSKGTASARLSLPGHRESATNFSGRSRRFLLYQYRAGDAWPLLSPKEGIEKFNEQLIVGEPGLTPRPVTLPVPIPLPPAEHQGPIHENQRASGRHCFATPEEPARVAAE